MEKIVIGAGHKACSADLSSEQVSALGFNDFGLIEPLLRAVSDLGHEVPTPIQQQAIIPALAGRDVLGSAQTGTGKTAAFALPLLQRLIQSSNRQSNASRYPIRALILAPTRELAAQIDESLGEYGAHTSIRHTMICGGVGMAGQVRELRRGVDVLVATPGRLEDLISQRVVELGQVEVLVLDEVDRMVDQGFLPAVRRIVGRTPKSRQTLLFSATLPDELRRLALAVSSRPVEVSAGELASTPDTIDQVVYHVAQSQKRQMLEHLVSCRDITRALVFTRTKHGADRVARHLKAAAIGADALHGGKSQNARQRALEAFRDGSLRVLVATDLAARGIHVDGISHVINFDLPVDADSYVHRIGRTARAGASGKALSLCCAEERDVLSRIEKLIRRRLPVAATPESLPPLPKATFQNDRSAAPRPAFQNNRSSAPRPAFQNNRSSAPRPAFQNDRSSAPRPAFQNNRPAASPRPAQERPARPAYGADWGRGPRAN